MRTALLLVLGSICFYATGQEHLVDAVSEQTLSLQEPEEGDESYENLSHLLSHPLNLNTATENELRLLNLLSEKQIAAILKHRNDFGDFISTLELQAIEELDLGSIEQVLPYVRVVDPTSLINKKLLHRMQRESETYILLRYESSLEDAKQFKSNVPDDERFKGIPGKTYLRFRSSRPGDFSYGLTAENDTGESFRWNPSKNFYGPDFLSGHLQLQNKGPIKNIILGDYQAQFGQGLVWGGVAGMGKGSETITSPRRINIGFAPYTSAYEAGNLRGLASTIQLSQRFKISSCYSWQRRDGSINGDAITAVQVSGMHRTKSELEKRRSWEEQIFGGAIQYRYKSLEAGLTLQHFQASKKMMAESRLYNAYTFRGSANTNASIFGIFNYRNMTFFSELALTLTQGHGFVGGIMLTLTPKFDATAVHRIYAVNYQPFFGNGFSENTRSQNESGTYWGWKYRFNRKWTHTGYVDIFRFPNLKYRVYSPSQGVEWLLRINWQPSRSTQVTLQARQEQKVRNQITQEKMYQVLPTRKTNYWINIDFGLNQNLKMKSRIQYGEFMQHTGTTNGFTIAQDFIGQTGKFKISLRYALFDTEDWDNRHYLYEQDVWLAYSLPAYDGVGVKKMAMIEYKLSRKITLWLRLARLQYRDRDTIGAGVDQILGNTRNDVKLQARLRL
jgi:hypothetical protein